MTDFFYGAFELKDFGEGFEINQFLGVHSLVLVTKLLQSIDGFQIPCQIH